MIPSILPKAFCRLCLLGFLAGLSTTGSNPLQLDAAFMNLVIWYLVFAASASIITMAFLATTSRLSQNRISPR